MATIGLGILGGEEAIEIQVRIMREGCECNQDCFAKELRQVQPVEERTENVTLYPLLEASSRGKTGP